MSRPRAAPRASKPAATSPPEPRNRPAPWWAILSVASLILAAPAWMAADPLGGIRWNDTPTGLASQFLTVAAPLGSARLDPADIPWVATSRPAHAIRQGLLDPIDGEVSPGCRLLAHVLGRLSGNLARLPVILTLASYAALLGVAAAAGHLVAWESRALAPGLATMALVALSSVLEPATASFAASRSLVPAFVALVVLVLLQTWRGFGGAWWYALALLASATAPLFGPTGVLAGLAALAYLLADGSPFKLASPPAVASLLTASLALARTGPPRLDPDAFRSATEALLFPNLGLDVAVNTSQALTLGLAAVALWAWSRKPGQHPLRPNPLEAAGAAFLASLFVRRPGPVGLVFPYVGLVVLVAGSWTTISARPSFPARPSRGTLLGLLALTLLLVLIQSPRFRRLGEAREYPVTPAEVEANLFPTPSLRWWRTKYLAEDVAGRQSQFLARLDRAEARARALGISRDDVLAAFPPLEGPGLEGSDARTLLDLPRTGRPHDPASVRAALGGWLTVEPEPRPEFLPAGAPWPPKEGPR